MGDLIPSFTIATVLAILLFRRSQSLTAWLLPVVVLAEVTIQSAWLDTFHDFTIAQVFPFITIGGTDGIPSGSMARLLSVFVLAAVLWGPHDARAARRIIDIGAVVIFVELVSRLYLARHLLADIVGGLLLGIVLSIVFGWIAHVVPGRSPNRSPSPAVSAGN
jgi:hypothetical protein